MRSGFVSIPKSGPLVLVAAAALGGCYSYQPIAPEAVAPGSTVRAELSDPGMLRVADTFGEPRRTVEGEVLQIDGDVLLLLARTGTSVEAAGTAPYPLRQRVQVEQGDLLRIEERQLHRGRTAGITGVLTAGFVALSIYFMTGRARGEIDRTNDTPPLS